MTHREVSGALAEMRARMALKIVSGHCSERLLAQLAGHWCRMPQMFGDRELLIDVHTVADQIGVMEGAALSRAVPTKPATEFTAGQLAGLWHKHWFQAGFRGNVATRPPPPFLTTHRRLGRFRSCM